MRKVGYKPKSPLDKEIYTKFFSAKGPDFVPADIRSFEHIMCLTDMDGIIKAHPEWFKDDKDDEARYARIIDMIYANQAEYCAFIPAQGDAADNGRVDGAVESKSCQGMYVSKAFHKMSHADIWAWLQENEAFYSARKLEGESQAETKAMNDAVDEDAEKKAAERFDDDKKKAEAGQAEEDKKKAEAGQSDKDKKEAEASEKNDNKKEGVPGPQGRIDWSKATEVSSRAKAVSMVMGHIAEQTATFDTMSDAAKYLRRSRDFYSRRMAKQIDKVNRDYAALMADAGKSYLKFAERDLRAAGRRGSGQDALDGGAALPDKNERQRSGLFGRFGQKIQDAAAGDPEPGYKIPRLVYFSGKCAAKCFTSARSFLESNSSKLKASGSVIGLATGTALFAASHPLRFLKNTAKGIKNAINDAVERNAQPGNEKTVSENLELFDAGNAIDYGSEPNLAAAKLLLAQAQAAVTASGNKEAAGQIAKVLEALEKDDVKVTEKQVVGKEQKSAAEQVVDAQKKDAEIQPVKDASNEQKTAETLPGEQTTENEQKGAEILSDNEPDEKQKTESGQEPVNVPVDAIKNAQETAETHAADETAAEHIPGNEQVLTDDTGEDDDSIEETDETDDTYDMDEIAEALSNVDEYAIYSSSMLEESEENGYESIIPVASETSGSEALDTKADNSVLEETVLENSDASGQGMPQPETGTGKDVGTDQEAAAYEKSMKQGSAAMEKVLELNKETDAANASKTNELVENVHNNDLTGNTWTPGMP